MITSLRAMAAPRKRACAAPRYYAARDRFPAARCSRDFAGSAVDGLMQSASAAPRRY